MPRVHHQGCAGASRTQTDGLSSEDATWGRPRKLEICTPSESVLGIKDSRRLRVDLVTPPGVQVGDHGSTDSVCTPPGITQPNRSDFAAICGIYGNLLPWRSANRDVGMCGVSALDGQRQGRALLSSLATWSYVHGAWDANPALSGRWKSPRPAR